MLTSVAPRRALRNTAAPAVLAPESFVVIVSKVIDADHLQVVLRGDHVGTLAGAVAHARTVLAAANEHHGNVSVVVLGHDGMPLFFAEAGESRRGMKSQERVPETSRTEGEAAAPAVVRVGEPDAVFSGLKCSVCGWHLRPIDGTTCKPCGAELSARLVAWARTLPLEAMVQAAYAKHLASQRQGGAS